MWSHIVRTPSFAIRVDRQVINGEAVAAWDLRRYDQLIAGAKEVTFTFLNGNVESTKTVPLFVLVP